MDGLDEVATGSPTLCAGFTYPCELKAGTNDRHVHKLHDPPFPHAPKARGSPPLKSPLYRPGPSRLFTSPMVACLGNYTYFHRLCGSLRICRASHWHLSLRSCKIAAGIDREHVAKLCGRVIIHASDP